jgi:hypothetical protein
VVASESGAGIESWQPPSRFPGVSHGQRTGSHDPFIDAVSATAAMSRHDFLSYRPHIGVASGPVIVGYAGTAFRYNVSVFGAPVALATRCAAVKPAVDQWVSSTIVTPSSEWSGRDIAAVVTPADDKGPIFEHRSPRTVPMKGLGDVLVQEI